ncbi:MAG: tail fiber protein [Bacteroidota bacterium]
MIKPLHIILVISIFLSYSLKAQIGINTLAPDTTAALDIYPKANSGGKMGILIPRLGETTRLSMTKAGKGLMVYDTTNLMFYVNLTSGAPTWYAINPWRTNATASAPGDMYTNSTVNNVGIGTNSPSAKLDVVGDIKSSVSVSTNTLAANTVTVTGFPVNPLVPRGAIIMWSGGTPPTGWGFCDGTIQSGLQTPDLRGRFIVGYDGSVNVLPTVAPANGTTTNYGAIGNTGGETGHTLAKSELPKHQHTVNTSTTDGGAVSVSGSGYGFLSTAGSLIGMSGSNYSADAYDHSHSISGSSGNGTTDGLNNQVHENRPPYYVLAYIIKL